MTLTDAQVVAIRVSGLTDRHWERKLRIPSATIRRARIGETYTHVPTPPDATPRRGSGRWPGPYAKPAKLTRGNFNV